tara:strand:- start:515 stop:1375 length:861 start_codon:yes stop_codon:yes gene_type:complete
MARILDKDTRLIDLDFGPITVNYNRLAGQEFPDGSLGNVVTFGGQGFDSMLRFETAGEFAGSYIQFQRIDLDYMTMNNEVVQPVEVSVQRSAAVPYGNHQNGNNFSMIKEYIFVFTRPLNNEAIVASSNPYLVWDEVGLQRGNTSFGGGYGIKFEQNVYAECRQYVFSSVNGALLSNGELVSDPPQPDLASWFSQPTLQNVTTWGSLSAITGPNLYAYRIVVSECQSFPANGTIFTNVAYGGSSTLRWSPVSVAFLCKDPKYTEGEYLSRLANAMNNTAEGEVVYD